MGSSKKILSSLIIVLLIVAGSLYYLSNSLPETMDEIIIVGPAQELKLSDEVKAQVRGFGPLKLKRIIKPRSLLFWKPQYSKLVDFVFKSGSSKALVTARFRITDHPIVLMEGKKIEELVVGNLYRVVFVHFAYTDENNDATIADLSPNICKEDKICQSVLGELNGDRVLSSDLDAILKGLKGSFVDFSNSGLVINIKSVELNADR